MRRKMGFVFMAFFVVGLSGCVSVNRIGDFTIISSKNIDLSRGANFKRGATRVKGQHMVSNSGFTPVVQPNMKQAIDNAIESVPGAVALLDGVISQRIAPFKTGYVVEGTPLIDLNLLTDTIPTPVNQSSPKSK
ncbi:MAG: hypothetical protein NTZ63_06800 [Candidatus Omnitrophica bacterium]|nr:hypothetical protein [Candidatus Omnitrophota bacterium]